MKNTTLGDNGQLLPAGILKDGKLSKPFSLRPFRLKEEKAIAALKEKPNLNVATYVSGILALLCETIGGTDLGKLDEKDKLLFISQMYMGDVLYLYTYLRLESMGEDVRVKVPCGKCKSHFDFIGDLKTLDVRVAETAADLSTSFTLKSGLEMAGATRKVLKLAPIRWSVFENVDLANVGAARLNTFQNAIVGVEGIDPFPGVPDQILENMTKRDVEALAKHIEGVNPAPALAVEAVCPKCKSKWVGPIDWGYDSFFGPSSL